MVLYIAMKSTWSEKGVIFTTDILIGARRFGCSITFLQIHGFPCTCNVTFIRQLMTISHFLFILSDSLAIPMLQYHKVVKKDRKSLVFNKIDRCVFDMVDNTSRKCNC